MFGTSYYFPPKIQISIVNEFFLSISANEKGLAFVGELEFRLTITEAQ
jgi:hypothetical protein